MVPIAISPWQGEFPWTILAIPVGLHVGLWVCHGARSWRACTSLSSQISPVSIVLLLSEAGLSCVRDLLVVETNCQWEQTKEKMNIFSWWLSGYFQSRRNIPEERSMNWPHSLCRGLLLSIGAPLRVQCHPGTSHFGLTYLSVLNCKALCAGRDVCNKQDNHGAIPIPAET